MKLVVQDPEPVLFATGEVLDAEIIPSATTGRAMLVIDRKKSLAQWLTPTQAIKEQLGVQEATERELGMLRAAGYRLAMAPSRKG